MGAGRRSVNANNTIIYPYTGFEIVRRAGTFTFSTMGRVSEVSHLIKTTGNNSSVYNSTSYPVDMTLAQLGLGLTTVGSTSSPTCPWTEGTSALAVDTIAVWNSGLNRFDYYYQFTDGTWRKVGGGTTNQSGFVVHAGTAVNFIKREQVNPNQNAPASTYLVPVMPYTLN